MLCFFEAHFRQKRQTINDKIEKKRTKIEKKLQIVESFVFL